MIGFLFGLAAGLAVGCVLGALAAAVYEEKMGRVTEQIFKHGKPFGDPIVTMYERPAAGVKVCSCLGAVRGPHFVDPECPFHGGAA